MDRQPRDLPRFAQDLGDQFVTILQAVFPLGAKISRDAAEVSEFHFNVNWRAHEPTHLRRIVLILSTTLLEEYQNREHRPTIERWVIAYVNQGQQPQRLGIMIGVAVRVPTECDGRSAADPMPPQSSDFRFA